MSKNPSFAKKPEFLAKIDDVRKNVKKPEFFSKKSRPSFGRGLIISLIDLSFWYLIGRWRATCSVDTLKTFETL